MRKAALYIEGRIVIADSHLEAYRTLTFSEQNSESLVSGFYDSKTGEFCSDCERDHFYDKEMILIRHAEVCDSNHPDPNISNYGVFQAEKIANTLSEFPIEKFSLYCSPMLRCLETASIVSETLSKK